MQGFDCAFITFKNDVNMFEHMEITESICEGVVEPSYKKILGQVLTMLVTAG